MKKALLFFLLYSVAGMAQSGNFAIAENKLVWETVFISDESNVPQLIERHPRLKIISAKGNIYKGTGAEIKNTCPGASDFMNYDFGFNFEIELREGKYRVTVTNIVFTKTSRNKGRVSTADAAEKYFTENGNLRAGAAVQSDLACLETFFNRVFTMTRVYRNKS